MNTTLEQDISELIDQLGDRNTLTRQRARLALVHMRQAALPALLETLDNANAQKRWEAARALGDLNDLHDSQIAAALSSKLVDEDVSVRWVAMESLIRQGRVMVMRPMLGAFVKNFDSTWMREGVHHVLHVFKDRDLLNPLEIKLFGLLDQQEVPGLESRWNGQAAWAAEKALEALDRE